MAESGNEEYEEACHCQNPREKVELKVYDDDKMKFYVGKKYKLRLETYFAHENEDGEKKMVTLISVIVNNKKLFAELTF